MKLIEIDGRKLFGLKKVEQGEESFVRTLLQQHSEGDEHATYTLVWLNAFNEAFDGDFRKFEELGVKVDIEVKREVWAAKKRIYRNRRN